MSVRLIRPAFWKDAKRAARRARWSHREGTEVCAPVSFRADRHYVVSHHAADRHALSYRPPTEHHPLGVYPTPEAAFEAADDDHAARRAAEIFAGLDTYARGQLAVGTVWFTTYEDEGDDVCRHLQALVDAWHKAARTPPPSPGATES